jgi:hypothetical protein
VFTIPSAFRQGYSIGCPPLGGFESTNGVPVGDVKPGPDGKVLKGGWESTKGVVGVVGDVDPESVGSVLGGFEDGSPESVGNVDEPKRCGSLEIHPVTSVTSWSVDDDGEDEERLVYPLPQRPPGWASAGVIPG